MRIFSHRLLPSIGMWKAAKEMNPLELFLFVSVKMDSKWNFLIFVHPFLWSYPPFDFSWCCRNKDAVSNGISTDRVETVRLMNHHRIRMWKGVQRTSASVPFVFNENTHFHSFTYWAENSMQRKKRLAHLQTRSIPSWCSALRNLLSSNSHPCVLSFREMFSYQKSTVMYRRESTASQTERMSSIVNMNSNLSDVYLNLLQNIMQRAFKDSE